MTVKVVTDSTADLTPDQVRQLGITVVPVYIQFGDRCYRDGVDIGHEELYERIQNDPVKATTSQPTPSDFANAYKKLSRETDEILSIQLTSKLSGTYSSALQGKEMMEGKYSIEVIDSLSTSMGLGLMTLVAARMAQAGKGIAEITQEIKELISKTHIYAVFDTLKYVLRGGRLGRAKMLLGSILNVKPMLTLRKGTIWPLGIARTRSKGIDKLLDMLRKNPNAYEVGIVHSTTPEEAQTLKERASSIIDKSRISISRLGPALGIHGGPGALLLAFREKIHGLGQEAGEAIAEKRKGISLPSINLPKLCLAYR